ncbi:hypothetical protein CMQ_7852 [Grosmannia clavigera kw1407]|uniref:HCNGP-like protein n=1 Tax=Grosmannia clavigera (strain kw1407 / UAMH 11150) TaxID=655863 RepID=F0XSB9_GROCL|nr:uncharacterized protein CMQ_7852 [Grosmannia clavigera kw1407]EFW99484.1 hypothetical protein CMQ_7852 [Grosmannia clavigera kw1407]
MAGLVAYASSDEEEDVAQEEVSLRIAGSLQAQQPASPSEAPDSVKPAAGAEGQASLETQRTGTPPAESCEDGQLQKDVPDLGTRADESNVLIGPARPDGSNGAAALLPADDDDDGNSNGDGDGEPPLSPYSAERALLRQLTLPRVADFAIPGSPPGTPPPGLETLSSKFDTFLALKRDKATHFNARLAQSGAMKNPAVMDKLMAFVGLDGTGPAQYGTVLPAEVWNPDAEDRTAPVFPDWAYRHPLRKVQEELGRQRARAAGERVEFVVATASRTGSSAAGTTTASIGPITGKRKSRFD